MPVITEYRVVSESEGWITERNSRESAEKRKEELNNMNGIPNDHYVEKVDEVL